MTPVLTQSKKLTHFYFIPINKSFVHSSYKVSIINLFRSFKSGYGPLPQGEGPWALATPVWREVASIVQISSLNPLEIIKK